MLVPADDHRLQVVAVAGLPEDDLVGTYLETPGTHLEEVDGATAAIVLPDVGRRPAGPARAARRAGRVAGAGAAAHQRRAVRRAGRRLVAVRRAGLPGHRRPADRGVRRSGRPRDAGRPGPGGPVPARGVRGPGPDRARPARPGDPAAVRDRPDAGERQPAGRATRGGDPPVDRGRRHRRDHQGHPADHLRAVGAARVAGPAGPAGRCARGRGTGAGVPAAPRPRSARSTRPSGDDVRGHLLAVLREALANAARHAPGDGSRGGPGGRRRGGAHGARRRRRLPAGRATQRGAEHDRAGRRARRHLRGGHPRRPVAPSWSGGCRPAGSARTRAGRPRGRRSGPGGRAVAVTRWQAPGCAVESRAPWPGRSAAGGRSRAATAASISPAAEEGGDRTRRGRSGPSCRRRRR